MLPSLGAKMIFDWTISLGSLITIVGFIVSGLIFVMMMRADMMVLGQRINNVEMILKDLAAAGLAVARQEARIETLDERLNSISQRLDAYIIRPKD